MSQTFNMNAESARVIAGALQAAREKNYDTKAILISAFFTSLVDALSQNPLPETILVLADKKQTTTITMCIMFVAMLQRNPDLVNSQTVSGEALFDSFTDFLQHANSKDNADRPN